MNRPSSAQERIETIVASISDYFAFLRPMIQELNELLLFAAFHVQPMANGFGMDHMCKVVLSHLLEETTV